MSQTYYRSVGRSNAARLHTDPDCRSLSTVENVREESRSSYPDASICRVCTGDVETPAGTDAGPWQALEAMDPDDLDVRALAEAEDDGRGSA